MFDDKIFSVSEISEELKGILRSRFSCVSIKGEISGVKESSIGHKYFNLKDENALINAVCWKGIYLPMKIEDGIEVICSGNISIYQQRSVYQLTVQSIKFSGIGSILALIEKRKQKLKLEGIFDKKKKLPSIPETIGIITSQSGAVIEDMLHRINDRFPIKVVLCDVRVQGESAASEIIKAISYLNTRSDIELIIIARGGGSIEDLMCFNDEELARAISNSKTPTVSAIGHETDFTIADFAADLRAPTPSAAIEMVLPNITEIRKYIDTCIFKIESYSESTINGLKLKTNSILVATSMFEQSFYHKIYNKIYEYGTKIKYHKPKSLFEDRFLLNDFGKRILRFELQLYDEKLKKNKESLLNLYTNKLRYTSEKTCDLYFRLSRFDIQKIMEMGFSIVKHADTIITNSSDVTINSELKIKMANGSLRVIVK